VARQVYFSFHFQRDIQRANVVRKSQTIKAEDEEVGYYDHSLWEEAETKGEEAIKALIDGGLAGASVTAVLIGAETYSRPWVLYEIAESRNAGMGLLGINLCNIPDWDDKTEAPGPNPFAEVSEPTVLGGQRSLDTIFPVHDWVNEEGYANAASWIELAAEAAGKVEIRDRFRWWPTTKTSSPIASSTWR
jgi:hypothetical protein